MVPGISVTARTIVLEPADRPHDLERQLRNAVAEIRERQPLEHHIGEPAIGRRVAAPSLATISGSGVLVLAAAYRRAWSAPVRSSGLPSAQMRADAADRPFAQADREIGEIAVGRRVVVPLPPPPLPPLGLVLVRDHLFELGRPDHLAGEPRAAVDARDRRALGRGHHVEIGEPRTFDVALARAAEQRAVDQVAAERADEAARRSRRPDRTRRRRPPRRRRREQVRP